MRRAGRYAAVLGVIGFGYLAYLYLTLPDVRELRTRNLDRTAFMQLREREARAEKREPKHVQQWIPYGRISSNLKRAVLVAEDAGFWGHEGIDLVEIKKSLETDWETGAFLRGASTITQQLAKNLYLSPSRNPFRKLRELIIARRLEHELSKTRILELYLNDIEWGDGIYGAEAAARSYFGASASSLDPDQAALMAGAIVNPRELNVSRPNGRLRARQRIIRARMGNVTPPPTVPVPAPAEQIGLPAAPPESLPEAMPENGQETSPSGEPSQAVPAEPSSLQEPPPGTPDDIVAPGAPGAPPAAPTPQPFPGAGRP
jgi:monofunctional biosynthetic peptidoglycan transglycosylase